MDCEGIFRISGNKETVENYIAAINKGDPICTIALSMPATVICGISSASYGILLPDLFSAGSDIDFVKDKASPHDVASLLKQFLRELPDPLLTGAMYDQWLALAGEHS